MKKRVLTVTMNPAFDKTVIVPGFALGRDFYEQRMTVTAGGKGINISRALGCLGIANRATGLIGLESKERFCSLLDEEGIAHDFSPVEGASRTNLTIIDPSNGAITRVLERGPRADRGHLSLFYKKFVSLLTGTRIVVLSGKGAPGSPDSLYKKLLQEANRRSVATVLDTSGRFLRHGLTARPTMLKLNLEELREAAGPRGDVRRLLCAVQGRGIALVCVTMGEKGAIVYDGNEMFAAHPPRVASENTVGCGDAFTAGFISAWIHKQPLQTCLARATAAGTANALTLTPGMVTRSDLEKILKAVRVEKIAV